MAAQINERPAQVSGGNVRKPQLVNKLEGHSGDISMAVTISRAEGVISVSDDRTVRIWLKRDSGQYWPSICHSMPCAPSCLDFNTETRRLFVGLDSGVITEFLVAEDYNHMTNVRDYFAHQGHVSAVLFSLNFEWVLSCARDKFFQWHCSESGRRLGGLQLSAWCTSIQFDVRSKYVFIGDYGGQIYVIKITNNGCEIVTTLKGHSGSVCCLAWDEERSLLFSGSFDQSIIVWDIGGQQGTAYELQGHHDKVQCLAYTAIYKQLLSTGNDAVLGLWNMDVKRQETPDWSTGDACEKCNSPFFWNVKSMFQQKTIGVRQHHCRKCGKAICAKCSQGLSTLPVMGYEYKVRVCDSCHKSVTDDDRVPMATFHDLKDPIVYMHLDEMKKILLTVGKDRVMKLWDMSSVLH